MTTLPGGGPTRVGTTSLGSVIIGSPPRPREDCNMITDQR